MRPGWKLMGPARMTSPCSSCKAAGSWRTRRGCFMRTRTPCPLFPRRLCLCHLSLFQSCHQLRLLHSRPCPCSLQLRQHHLSLCPAHLQPCETMSPARLNRYTIHKQLQHMLSRHPIVVRGPGRAPAGFEEVSKYCCWLTCKVRMPAMLSAQYQHAPA